MRVAVLGCNGYLGKHIAHFMFKQGCNVHGYARNEAAPIELSEYTQLDLLNKDDIEKLDTSVDFILYFCGVTGTSKAYDEYEKYVGVNETGLLHVLDRIRRTGSKARIVFPSTRLIYKGVANLALTEDAEKEYKTIYALNKWFGEQVIQQYAAYYNIPFTIFRVCVPYGNTLSDAYSYGTIGFMLSRAKAGKNITLYGTGDQKRTFTHVQDICFQIYSAMLSAASRNQVFNTNGETYSIKQVAEKIAHRYNIELEHMDWPEMDLKMESGDTIFEATRLGKIINTELHQTFDTWLKTL